MSSARTTRLRILNGTHAGACIDLHEGEQTIGRDPEHDIHIADWNESPLCLCCGADGVVTLRWPVQPPSTRAAASRATGAMAAFHPEGFGDIVLCIGPADDVWPTDMELLARAFQPKRARVREWVGAHARRVAALGVSAAMVLVAAVWFGVGLVQTPSVASAPPLSVERVASDLRASLARAGQSAIEVHAAAVGLEISGLVESREDARAIRQLLSALPGEVATAARFAVAQELTETLRTSIGIPGAKVRHLGHGVFSVEAEVDNVVVARAAIDRVVADLAPHVKRVEFADTGAIQRLNGQPVTAAYSDGYTSIVQTRDGAIHLAVTSPEHSASAPRRPSHR